MYLPSFKQLIQCVRWNKAGGISIIPDKVFKKFLDYRSYNHTLDLGSGHYIMLHADAFTKFLTLIIDQRYFDEKWYRNENPDVEKGIKGQHWESGLRHFCVHGYIEGRLPKAPEVDEAWYGRRYPDVEKGIRTRHFPSATKHYRAAGYFEGRVPVPGIEEEVIAWNDLISKHRLDAEV